MKKLVKEMMALTGATIIAASSILLAMQTKEVETKKVETTEKIVEVHYTKDKEDSDELFEMLQHRKCKVVVEVLTGTVDDNKGNGTDAGGYYIAYDKKRFHKGDKVQTVLIYNPENNYTDDILYRYDKEVK